MTLIQENNDIIAYEVHSTALVEAILNQVVDPGTQSKNEHQNADLILWIYVKYEWREAFLRDCMVERFITFKAEGGKVMRDICKDALKAINRNGDNWPILLEKMTFNLLSHYTTIKKLLTRECIYLPPSMEVSVVQ